MKKLISLALALVLICAMATTAFATETETGPELSKIQGEKESFTIVTDNSDGAVSKTVGDLTIGVEATYNNNLIVPTTYDEVDASYFVVVTWEVESTLAYVVDGEYVWKTYNENIEEAVAGDEVSFAGYEIEYTNNGWYGEANVSVTVENWSNRDVEAHLTYANTEGFDATLEYYLGDAKKELGEDNVLVLDLVTAAANLDINDKNGNPNTTMSSSKGTASIKVTEVAFTGSDDDVEAKIAEIADAVKAGENVQVGAVTVKLTGDNGAEFEIPVTGGPATTTEQPDAGTEG